MLGALAERARATGNLEKAVVTFDVHPRSVMMPATAPKMLSTVASRLQIFEELGIDYVGVLPFGRIRHLPPEDFIRRVVVDGFGARTVMVGRGFRYGTGRTGDVASLRTAGEVWGFAVEARQLLESARGPISSSFIRRCIADGDLATANRLLGRPHELPALATDRTPDGTGYGLPSALLEVDRAMAVPGQGVYAGWAVVRDGTLPTICHIGARAARSGSTEPIRAHMLDPEDELRTGEVGLRFAVRLSDHPPTAAGDETTGRIEFELARARRLLGGTGP